MVWTVLSDDNQALYHTDKEPTSGNYVHGKRTVGMFWDGSRMVSTLPGNDTARKKVAIRRERDTLLVDSDWRVIKAQETGTAMSAEWSTYRQALRDITSHANFPWLDDADWPVKPE